MSTNIGEEGLAAVPDPAPAEETAAAAEDERTPTTVQTLTPGRGGIAPYDFRRPTKLGRDSVRLLHVTFDTFARRLTTMLTSGLRQICQVKLTDITQQSYEDYITGRPTVTLMVPVNMPQIPTTGVLEFSLPVALTAIDHMLGGPGGQQPDRPLTDIETPLIRGLLEQITGVLGYVMEPLVDITPTLGTIEYNPQFMQVASAGDAVLVVMMSIELGKEQSELTLCLPLAPLLPRLVAPTTGPDGGDHHRGGDAATLRHELSERLGDVPISLSIEFTPTALSPGQVLELQPGDIIPLKHRIGAPLRVQFDDVTYATAVAGKSGKQLAALITETI